MAKDAINAFFKGYADVDSKLEFKRAVETVGQEIEVVPSGSYLLNEALSSGGYPKGRLIQFYGRAASGKTLMSMLAIREAQAQDPDASQVFIDAEGTFSADWAEELQINTARVILIQGDLAVNGRRLFEMLLGKPKEDAKHKLVGKTKEGLLDQVINKTININLFVLDSLGQIIPPGEDVSEVGKMNISLLSRFLTTTFRKLSLEVMKAHVPFIVINHARDNMDPYGKDHAFSGGNTYSHSLSANIWFKGIERKDAQIMDDKEEKIGHRMRATVEKSKFGPHPKTCEFNVDFSKGVIDQHEAIGELALKYGVVVKVSSVTHAYGDLTWVGEPKFFNAIKDNPTLAAEMLNKINVARDNIRIEKRSRQKEKIALTLSTDIDDLPSDDGETLKDGKSTDQLSKKVK